MKKPSKVTKPVKNEAVGAFSVKFSIGSDVYTANGDTLLEALQKIKPAKYSGLTKVEATVNGKTSRIPITLTPLRMRRFFEKPVELAIFAKRLNTLL